MGKNMLFDGRKAVTIGNSAGYRNDILIMTGKFVSILKIMVYGEVINSLLECYKWLSA
jgi:hypothetical protein